MRVSSVGLESEHNIMACWYIISVAVLLYHSLPNPEEIGPATEYLPIPHFGRNFLLPNSKVYSKLICTHYKYLSPRTCIVITTRWGQLKPRLVDVQPLIWITVSSSSYIIIHVLWLRVFYLLYHPMHLLTYLHLYMYVITQPSSMLQKKNLHKQQHCEISAKLAALN